MAGIQAREKLVFSTAAAMVMAFACSRPSSDGEGADAAAEDAKEPDTTTLIEGSTDGAASPVEPGTDFEVCAGVSAEPENTLAPADIVFLVDNSPSMRDEIAWTRENMNLFSQTLAERGIDARIVMISCLHDGCDGHASTSGICIDAPLGSGDCETSDTNLPDYLHLDVRMPSQKLLERAVDSFADWQGMRRPWALTHFVAISDDRELMSATEFRAALAALDPPLTEFVFHGIFSALGKDEACAISSGEPCCTYAAPGGEGVQYRELVEMTGGVAADLCAQDFDPVFTQFAQSVVAHAELACEWTIPPPPAGEELDPDLINLEFIAGDSSTAFGYVATAEDCGELEDAWYYDDPRSPQRVLVCPETCAAIRAAPAPRLLVTFGCKTVDAAVIR